MRQDLAEAYEADLKKTIRERASGVVPIGPEETPRFQDWAEIYLQHARRTMKRPDRVEDLLRVILRFWGPGRTAAARCSLWPVSRTTTSGSVTSCRIPAGCCSSRTG